MSRTSAEVSGGPHGVVEEIEERHRRVLQLPDGRHLGYAEWGDPAGRPVCYFHGFPQSRLEPAFADESASQLGVRLIAFDRPGYGLSDYKAGRTILDWPEDVSVAANALGIERFAVMGVSGGGPYAAACAFKLPDHVSSAAIVSGLGPTTVAESAGGYGWATRAFFRAYPRLSLLGRPAMGGISLFVRRFWGLAMFINNTWLPPSDRAVTQVPGIIEQRRQSLNEAFRQGARGPALDLALYSRPWGFELKEMGVPVQVWHGDADTMVPVAMARYLAATIPGAELHLVENGGHFVAVPHHEEILTTLLAAGSV
jgi:pimeloyl-ACP methyl ester carboxylesterase